MAFFVSNAYLYNQMVASTREGVSKANKPYIELTVLDDDGNVNRLSTTDPQTMVAVRSLQKGDYVDLRVVLAGGPSRQYAMLGRGDSVRISDASSVIPF